MFKSALNISLTFHFKIVFGISYCFDDNVLCPGFDIYLPFITFGAHIFKTFNNG